MGTTKQGRKINLLYLSLIAVFEKLTQVHKDSGFIKKKLLKFFLRNGVNAIIEGNIGVVYVNGVIAMNFRCYDLKEGNWGFFSTEGNTTFSEVTLLTR